MLAAAVNGGFIYTSTNAGSTWSISESPDTNWACITSSADGTKLAASCFYEGPIYTSSDSGRTWIPHSDTINGYNCLASSADGSRLAATQYAPEVTASTNYGATWVDLVADVIPTFLRYVLVVCSADGDQFVIGEGGVSADTLMTWTNMVADFRTPSSPAPFATQAPIYAPPFGNFAAVGITSSADGHCLAASCNGLELNPTNCGGGFFVSTNAGVNWSFTCSTTTNFVGIAASADGSRLLAAATGDTFYASTNAGAIWSPVAVPPANWSAVASSADGDRLVAAVNGGGIYIWQRRPNPVLKFSATETNLLLSWTIPSMDFVLQQNPDLNPSHWTKVGSPRTLIFSNIQYQVAVPTPADEMFFRLTAQ